MRGTRSIISSSGPTVQLESNSKSCYTCGEVGKKTGSLRISFSKHTIGFNDAATSQRVYLCLHCAGGITSAIVEFITDEATLKR
jgi:nitrate reductase cytochrome c-type subunit